jgi:hypothetical protein
MNTTLHSLRRQGASRRRLAAAAFGAALMAGPALAQSDAVATAPTTPDQAPPAQAQAAQPVSTANPPPSESMVINLIRLLVKQGVITQDAADALRQQAEDEAMQARAAAAATPPAPNLPPPAQGVVRVPYVPEVVRNQIRDEIKQDVLAQAQAEGWAARNAVPDWVNRITWSGDFRFRDQFTFYDKNNALGLIDYATFNANGPFDVNQLTNPAGVPLLDTLNNRINQLSLRARLAMTADVFKGVSTTIRLATGSDGSPVSTTQLLGGGLTKKDIWLDQAYITLTPTYWGSLQFGRLPNPFMYTDLVYDDNLNFDGVAAKASQPFGPAGLTLFGSGGAFPLDYVASNFPTNAVVKSSDRTKWLFAIQAGAEYKPDPLSWSLRGAVAYYDFNHVAGVPSDPCVLYDGNNQCDTDYTRPSFMQKGNTLFLLRNIVPNPASPNVYPQPQFLGLAYDYHVLDATGAFEMPLFGTTRLQIVGDYARNLAFDPARARASFFIVDNFDACPVTPAPPNCIGPYHSGDKAWLVKATIGNPRPGVAGDWNFTIGYKYIEPDAVLDAFNDHDFHLGGTNAKGYYITASYFFANNAWIDARWFSANQVYSTADPLAIDVLQLELNTRF